MLNPQELMDNITQCAKAQDIDLVCVGGAQRFAGTRVLELLPQARSVIALGARVLRGVYRGIEEGSTYYQYSTLGVEIMEETILPRALLRVCALLEDEGFLALPQRRYPLIIEQDTGVHPEVYYEETYRGCSRECPLDFEQTAALCGMGEIGVHGDLLTDEYGPMQRYCFILTDAELPQMPIAEPHLCDKCGACIAACPGGALSMDHGRDSWRCAVYYRGANRSRNPFMPETAYRSIPNREAVMDGSAALSPQEAIEVMDETIFYPPIKQGYASCICGRACDTACYIRLEESGLLKNEFKEKFRRRAQWKLSD